MTEQNDIRYEVTVGEYEELTSLGTYSTRDEAVKALGEFALGGGRVEYPAVNEIVQLQAWG